MVGRAISPPCPACATSKAVSLKSGGAAGTYRYACRACGLRWQQVPPHRKGDASQSDRIRISSRKSGEPYRCSICLQIKKNHVCTGFSLDDGGRA